MFLEVWYEARVLFNIIITIFGLVIFVVFENVKMS